MQEGPYINHLFDEKVIEMYQRHKNWLICAVHHSIFWPEKDVLLQYDGESYILRGLKNGDEFHQASIVVPLTSVNDVNTVLKKVYKFTSMLGWFKGGYVDVVGHTNGSLIRWEIGRQQYAPFMASGPYGFDCNYMPIINDEKTRKALAFWREGLKLRYVHLGYLFLSFYKVIESQFKKGKDKGSWINSVIPELQGEAKARVDELRTLHDGDFNKIGGYIWESGRCAVAHAAFDEESIDPDAPEDRIRIERDLVVIQSLAEKYIKEELCVPTQAGVNCNRDALKDIYQYVDPRHLLELQQGVSIPRRRLGVNGIKVSINRWPYEAPEKLRDFSLQVKNANNGVVDIVAVNGSKTMYLGFSFNFIEKKARINWDLNKARGDTHQLSFLKYQRDIIANGIIEILLPNGCKIVCEPTMLDISIGRSLSDLDQQIQLAKEYEKGTVSI